ncbi:MAG: hypothetical protein DRQ37_06340 [Gammaproteobacteria bacterium]|nr:MAG: hypothetical protein DRQ37_06340 [Gammaproteobacteria bacterium]
MTLVPPGSDLLDIARKELRELLLGELPPEKRYAGLMIANAMAIARRELLAGETTSAPEREQLSEILGMEGDLEALRTELAKQIRAGRYKPEDEDYDKVTRHLQEAATHALATSNPRYLKR